MEDFSTQEEISVEPSQQKFKFEAGPALSRWNHLEDWLWYESQADFECQANQNVGCLNGRGGRACRIFLALIITSLTIFSYIVTSDHARYFSYFTIWGVLFTNGALLTGAFVNDHSSRDSLAPSDARRSKYGCHLWKVFTVLYQVAFLCEIIIVPYFWTSLYQGFCYYDGQVIDGWPYYCWPTLMDHSVPLTCLILSQFVYVQPFVRRHLVIMVSISALYLINNFLWTKLSGIPVYPTMDWSSPKGIITPLVIPLFAPLFFFLLAFLNNLKLRAVGHHQIIEISTGRALKLKKKLEEQQPVLDP